MKGLKKGDFLLANERPFPFLCAMFFTGANPRPHRGGGVKALTGRKLFLATYLLPEFSGFF